MKLANSATLCGNAVVDRLSGGPLAWSSMVMPLNPGKLVVEARALTVSLWKGEPVGSSSKTWTISSGKLSPDPSASAIDPAIGR